MVERRAGSQAVAFAPVDQPHTEATVKQRILRGDQRSRVKLLLGVDIYTTGEVQLYSRIMQCVRPAAVRNPHSREGNDKRATAAAAANSDGRDHRHDRAYGYRQPFASKPIPSARHLTFFHDHPPPVGVKSDSAGYLQSSGSLKTSSRKHLVVRMSISSTSASL